MVGNTIDWSGLCPCRFILHQPAEVCDILDDIPAFVLVDCVDCAVSTLVSPIFRIMTLHHFYYPGDHRGLTEWQFRNIFELDRTKLQINFMFNKTR